MKDVKQRLNKVALDLVLEDRKISQIDLANAIGANDKSFSRWINDGYIYSKYLWDLTETLDLKDSELDEILMLPKHKVFFRKKYLQEPPEEVKQQAIDLSKTLFGLTYLNSRAHFFPQNLSKVQSVTEVADHIRKLCNLNNFNYLHPILHTLSNQGIEVAIIPFKKLKLVSPDEHEKAFSVTNEQRFLIFLDSSNSEELLIFNLCHELSHLFRPDHNFSKEEETFCNKVASELIYPKNYFDQRQETINKIISSRSEESIFSLLNNLKYELGGEIFGCALRLKDLGFFSQKDVLHKRIISLAEANYNRLPKIGNAIFEKYDPSNLNSFQEFWSNNDIDSNILLRFFFHIKNGAINNSITARKFSELFGVNIGAAEEMFRSWTNSALAPLKVH